MARRGRAMLFDSREGDEWILVRLGGSCARPRRETANWPKGPMLDIAPAAPERPIPRRFCATRRGSGRSLKKSPLQTPVAKALCPYLHRKSPLRDVAELKWAVGGAKICGLYLPRAAGAPSTQLWLGCYVPFDTRSSSFQ